MPSSIENPDTSQKPPLAFLINSMGGGGAERVLRTLINYLTAHYTCYLILMEKETISYSIHPGVKIISLNGVSRRPGLFKLFALIGYCFKLKTIIKRHRFTTVCSFLYRANYVNVLTKILFKTHRAIISERSFPSAMQPIQSISGQLNRALIRCLYNHADLIIPVSKAVQSDLINTFNIRVPQTVIYNPYDIQKIQTLSLEKTVITTPKQYNIITVGSLMPHKNQALLIHAFSKLKTPGTLYILGDGEKKASLTKLVASLGIEQKVVFLGFDSNPYKYMAKCGVYVHTSNIEGFPNVLVEAMICQCAVISVDCSSGPREIIAPKSNIHHQVKHEIEITDYGILTPLNNADLIAKAITIIWDDAHLRTQLVTASQTRVLSLSLDKIAHQYEMVLNKN